MAGIKDLLSLFYWINNQKEAFLDASIGLDKPGNHQSDREIVTQKNRGSEAEDKLQSDKPKKL